MLGLLCARFGVVLGRFGDDLRSLGDVLGTFLACFWKVWGMFLVYHLGIILDKF